MTDLHSYSQPSRRPVGLALAAAFAFMLLLLESSGAIWVFYVPACVGFAIMLFALIKCPVNGLVVTQAELVLSAWRSPRSIPLQAIEAVEIIEWGDTADMKIHLKSGAAINASSGDIPPREPFRAVLAAAGIQLVES